MSAEGITQLPERGRSVWFDLDAEAALLGAMIISKDARLVAIEACLPGDFSTKHMPIFIAISDLMQSAAPVDAVTIAARLSELGALEASGGRQYLVELQAGTGSTRNAPAYAKTVHEKGRNRRANGASLEFQKSLAEGLDMEAATAKLFDALTEAETNSEIVGMAGGIDAFLERLEQGRPKGTVPTGLIDLDRFLNGGLTPGAFTVVGARPSMGKSAFASSVATSAAKAGIPVFYVTCEMTVLEVMMRMIASEANLDLSLLLGSDGGESFSDGEWGKLSKSLGQLGQLPITFLDHSSPTVPEIRQKVQQLRATSDTPPGLVIVDYLQLLAPANPGRSDNRQNDVSEMSRGLKNLARDLDLATLALSQLSRGLEARSDKRPMLSDLRESGAIEQDADNVMFLYRNEVYEPGVEPGIMEVNLAKQRNGPTGTVRASWIGDRTAIRNLARLDGPGGGI